MVPDRPSEDQSGRFLSDFFYPEPSTILKRFGQLIQDFDGCVVPVTSNVSISSSSLQNQANSWLREQENNTILYALTLGDTYNDLGLGRFSCCGKRRFVNIGGRVGLCIGKFLH